MRVLYKILLLNIWHSLQRSRFMMPGLVVALAVLVAGGGYLTIQGVQMAEQKLSSTSEARPGDADARSSNSLGVPKQSSLSNDPDSSTGDDKPVSSNSQKPTQSTTNESVSDAIKVAAIVLDPAASTCIQGQRTYQVASAALALTGAPDVGKTVRWYWETRIDGGQAPDKESLPSGDVRTLTLSGNDQEASLLGPVSGDPLISTAVNSSYAYSFRLHVISPNDVSSPWVTIPVLDESNSCSS